MLAGQILLACGAVFAVSIFIQALILWGCCRLCRARMQERPTGSKAPLITDFTGYNTAKLGGGMHPPPPQNWAGDLMLECDVEITKGQGELVLELGRGVEHFQARFDLVSGSCDLSRTAEARSEKLATQPTSLHGLGKHRLRFANVDDRLLVWVDDTLPFGDGVPYPAPPDRGPREADVRPVRIGVSGGGVIVTHLQIWRDTYYTTSVIGGPGAGVEPDYSQPKWWEALRDLPLLTLYVQPDHYLVLGDNSAESSDSRSWGLVPRRLLVGPAVFRYAPLRRLGSLPAATRCYFDHSSQMPPRGQAEKFELW